uniref:WASH complex subunit strumpellin n=1 Tax=Romanomermis culicivorax TaxID=13658 RepID=A0A915HGY6_ROMCU
TLLDLDDELRENYLEIVTRFYSLFESIYRYAGDLNRYVDDLEEGIYIQQSLETVLSNADGKQLLFSFIHNKGYISLQAEALYLYGVMLLLLDSKIDGVVRERMIVTFYRFSGKRSASESNIDDVCRLLRTTGDSKNKRPANYPENFFKFPYSLWLFDEFRRVGLNPLYVNLLIGRLRSDDIYNQIIAFPLPDHRSVAFSQQAAMLYIALFFAPDILTNQFPVMREIVDKYFSDNWVINIYMGVTANLIDAWESYKAAKSALFNVHTPQSIKLLADRHASELIDLNKGLSKYITEGVITKEFVLDNTNKLINSIRRCNVALRWLMLHSAPLRQDKLKTIFGNLRDQFEMLTFEDEAGAGRKVVQLMSTIEEVQEVYGLDNNSQVKQFISDIRQLLHHLLKVLNLKETTLIQMQLICDFSYAWEITDNFTDLMQKAIRQNPAMPIKLRATFVKLSSAMDLPLLRIQQSNSPDLLSVSQFYSRNLVLYFRRVLQIIPQTVFSLLAKIVEIRTNFVKDLPTRMEKDKMKDYAKLDDRYEIARLTHSISVITEGVLTMKATLVGIIKVDPKKLLEDGIRKELVKNVATAMHNTLTFNTKLKQSELVAKLKSLANQVDAYRLSFEYISDYIGLNGLKIWLEEFGRLAGFKSNLVQDHDSLYQSRLIPIPVFPKLDQNFGFIGRLGYEILKETDVRTTVYVDRCDAWYDSKTHKECVNAQLFKVLAVKFVINHRIGVRNVGISALDRLYSFMITDLLQKLIQRFKKQVLSCQENVNLLTNAEKTMESSSPYISQPTRFYSNLSSKFAKIFVSLSPVLSKIGQMQILRSHLIYLMPHSSSSPFCLFIFLLVFNQISKFTVVKSVGLISKKPLDGQDGTPFVIGVATLLRQIGGNSHEIFLKYIGRMLTSFSESCVSKRAMKQKKIEPATEGQTIENKV